MLNAESAVEILRHLPRLSVVSTPSGRGVVLCHLRDKVTVLEGRTIRVWQRWECEVAA